MRRSDWRGSWDKRSARLAAVENFHDVPDDEPSLIDQPTAHR